MQKPEPPEELASYLVDGIDRQGKESLKVVERYAKLRRRYLESLDRQEINPDDLVGNGEDLVDVEDDGKGGTKVVKKVPCGKNCNGCPHGPYEYRVKRVDGKLDWDYIGKA